MSGKMIPGHFFLQSDFVHFGIFFLFCGQNVINPLPRAKGGEVGGKASVITCSKNGARGRIFSLLQKKKKKKKYIRR